MKEFVYYPKNVCSQELHFEIEDNKIINFYAVRGCNGNLKGIGELLKGMDIDTVISKLENVTCRGSRTGDTSCPMQIALALKEYKANN